MRRLSPALCGLLWGALQAMLGYASGQQPLTPGVGQYCSYYADGFTSYHGGFLQYNALNGRINALVCACGYMGVCANQGTPACPWEEGENCGVSDPCTYCDDDCDACAASVTQNIVCYPSCGFPNVEEGHVFCMAGCVTVSPCTPIPNAYFTGTASPSTSATGCPWACNNGYVKSGSSCIANTPSCTAGQYLPSGTATACIGCPAGTYSSGVGAISACAACAAGTYSSGWAPSWRAPRARPATTARRRAPPPRSRARLRSPASSMDASRPSTAVQAAMPTGSETLVAVIQNQAISQATGLMRNCAQQGHTLQG